MSLKKANKLFKEGNYKEAYPIYKKVESILGSSIIAYNLKICESKLNKKSESKNIITSSTAGHYLNQYFDNIYIVNLKHKVADRLNVANHLKQYGIKFEIFEATNGYIGEPLKKWNEYKQRPLGVFKKHPEYSEKEIKHNKSYIESAGAVGYIFTYLRILEDAKVNRYKRFLILEDDILLCNDFEAKFKKFTENIGDDWKILQLGASQYGWNSVNLKEATEKGFYLPRTMDTKGSYAIAFDHTVIDELIKEQSAFEAPFDHIPMGELYERYLNKCFVAFPYIVMPDVAESTIRDGRCQYTHSRRMKWELKNYDYPLDKPSISILITSKKNLKYYSDFSNTTDLPFNLRLFFNSIDGFRPLHKTELIDTIENNIQPINNKSFSYESDYLALINEDKILTEESIVQFIEYKTGISDINQTSLEDMVSDKKKIVKDRVSVILPSYKRPSNLKNALKSVVTQDYHDIEVIVVCDNGYESEFNKETKEIVDSMKYTNPKCKVILLEHSVNRNGSAARNTGFLHSTGEFIALLDDDDMYLQGRLSKTVEMLKNENKTIGAVYCGFLGWNSPQNDLERYQTGDLTLEILLLDYKKHYLHTNTATYRREAILNINGFDESYRRHQDLEFNLRFFEQYKIEALKECLVRLNPEPSEVSNKAFNTVMLDLKFKFLTQFKYIIEKYSIEEQYNIYTLHQNEALKYINEKNKAVELYKDKYYNYHTQMLLKLLNISNNNQYKEKEIYLYRINYNKEELEKELYYVEKNFKTIIFKTQLPLLFKDIIQDKRIKKYNSKLIFASSNNNVSEKTITESENIINELVVLFNTTKSNEIRFYTSVLLFSHNLMNEKKINLNKDTELFLTLNTKEICKNLNLNNINLLGECITDAFTALVYALAQHKFINAVKIKLELVMLLNFYFSKKLDFGSTNSLEPVIEIINIIFQDIFEYNFFDSFNKFLDNK